MALWLHALMSLSFPFSALMRQAGKKRPLDVEEETSDFFSWFDKENEDEEFIGQPMKEIWEEPVKVSPPPPQPAPFWSWPECLVGSEYLLAAMTGMPRGPNHSSPIRFHLAHVDA
jgi:hypothetical protein